MKTILVSYDLKAPGKDYSKLGEHLRSYDDYRKPLESFWLLKTSQAATAVRDAVKKYIDTNDKLLVIDVTGDAAAWTATIPDEIAKWIKENL